VIAPAVVPVMKISAGGRSAPITLVGDGLPRGAWAFACRPMDGDGVEGGTTASAIATATTKSAASAAPVRGPPPTRRARPVASRPLAGGRSPLALARGVALSCSWLLLATLYVYPLYQLSAPTRGPCSMSQGVAFQSAWLLAKNRSAEAYDSGVPISRNGPSPTVAYKL